MSDELTRLPDRFRSTRSRARLTLRPAVMVVTAPLDADVLQPLAATVLAANSGKHEAQLRAPADARLLPQSGEGTDATRPSGEALRAVAAYQRQAKPHDAASPPSLRCIA